MRFEKLFLNMRIFKGLILLLLFVHQYFCLPAFPGAEGFGSETIGGRGGRVIVVQNTNGDGPGSLHEALMAKGPRIITFRVGGTITFPKTTVVSEPFVTILGQTAPGEGITVTAVGAVKGEVFSIRTNDVIIRHMRFRAGPSTDPACCRDALTVYRGSNVVLDHITVSWGTDENISSAFSANNITWSNSMSAEALYNSNHEDDPNKPGSVEAHSMGALWSSASSLSIHHTLFTRNNGRNPRVADIRGIIDLRYNYVYQATNTIQLGTVSEKTTVCTAVNIVGCLIHEGSSSRNGVLIARHHDNPYCLYVKNNIGQHRPTPDLPEMFFVGSSSQSEDRIPSEFISTPHKAPAITRNPFGGSADSMNNDVREYALKHAGCTKPQRDADDKRVIEHVRNKNSGKRVDAPPNGIRQLPAGTPRADQDKDGLPDSVEASFGLKANEADSHRIDAATGYAYIELWANGKDLLGDEYVAPIVSTGQTPAVTPSTTKSTIIAPTQTPASTTPAPSPSTFEFQWGAAPSSSNPKLACTTASGAKMSFQATFDDAGIHIAAVITGDSTMFTPNDNNGKLYQDDALEMIFDVAKTGEQSLTPGSYKIMVSRAGKVRASEAYTVHDNGAELVLTAGTTSTSNGWQATALIRWTALQSAEDAASLSSADAAANSAIRFHVRLIDGETLEEQTTCDAPAQLDDVRQINQPELYATARFGAKQQVTSTSKNTGDTSASKPVVATPVYTTTANLYETFTIPPDSQCEQFPRTVGCPCTLDVERPCASSSLVCVDLGNEARCARLRESTSPQTDPLVSLAMHLSLSITSVVGGIVWQLLN